MNGPELLLAKAWQAARRNTAHDRRNLQVKWQEP